LVGWLVFVCLFVWLVRRSVGRLVVVVVVIVVVIVVVVVVGGGGGGVYKT
jgi:hypothetical protein